MAELAPQTETSLPATRPIEFLGRVVIAGAIASLLFLFLAAHADHVANWAGRELRILPRFGVFAGGALFALLVQGARTRRSVLLATALLSLLYCYFTLPFSQQELQTSTTLPVMQLLSYLAGLLFAVCFGTWLGRDLRNTFQFVTLVLCAAAGDVWLSAFHVPESVHAEHPLRLLRMVWPLQSSDIGNSPALSDLVFVAAFMEGARQVKIPQYAVVAGALAGYCAGSFLALEPLPGMPALSMVMCGSGILIGCWPDLKCSFRDFGRAFLIGALLLAALLGLSTLYGRFRPSPEPPPDPSYYRGVT